MDFDTSTDKRENAPRDAVGILLTSDGMPGSFAVFGLAPHLVKVKGQRYFSSVAFNDPMMIKSTDTVFTGVPLVHRPCYLTESTSRS